MQAGQTRRCRWRRQNDWWATRGGRRGSGLARVRRSDVARAVPGSLQVAVANTDGAAADYPSPLGAVQQISAQAAAVAAGGSSDGEPRQRHHPHPNDAWEVGVVAAGLLRDPRCVGDAGFTVAESTSLGWCCERGIVLLSVLLVRWVQVADVNPKSRTAVT